MFIHHVYLIANKYVEYKLYSLSLYKQDTVVALQALAKYSTVTFSPLGTIAVNVTSPSRQKYSFTINQQNRLVYQEKELQPPNGTFTLAARGSGCVFVQVSKLQSPLFRCYDGLYQNFTSTDNA